MYLSAMLMLSDIDFSTPQQKRKKNDINSSTSGGEWSKAASVSTLTPSPEELLSLYADLFMTGKPVLLSLLPEFYESHVPLCMRSIIPTPLTARFV